MTLLEAAKQALDFINRLKFADAEPEPDRVMEALRQAIEQAEKQEPVAWRTFDGEGNYDFRDYEMNENYAQEWAKRNPKHRNWVEPLYTAPPQQEPLTATFKYQTYGFDTEKGGFYSEEKTHEL